MKDSAIQLLIACAIGIGVMYCLGTTAETAIPGPEKNSAIVDKDYPEDKIPYFVHDARPNKSGRILYFAVPRKDGKELRLYPDKITDKPKQ